MTRYRETSNENRREGWKIGEVGELKRGNRHKRERKEEMVPRVDKIAIYETK